MISAIKGFINFEKALKYFSIVPNICKSNLKNMERYQEGLSYLAFCGFTINDELIEKVKKLSIETSMDFKESCYYYVNKYENKNPST